MLKRLLLKLKNHFIEVLKIKKTPQSIALGFAIGTFIAILPTFGLGLLIALFIISLFPKLSKISLIFAFVIWNPFVLISLYGLSYKLGEFLFGPAPYIHYKLNLFEKVYFLTRRYLVGNLIISLILSIISYLSILSIIYLRKIKIN